MCLEHSLVFTLTDAMTRSLIVLLSTWKSKPFYFSGISDENKRDTFIGRNYVYFSLGSVYKPIVEVSLYESTTRFFC